MTGAIGGGEIGAAGSGGAISITLAADGTFTPDATGIALKNSIVF